MFLPVQNKPSSTPDYFNSIIQVPNLIDENIANELKTFALNSDVSGWHRRGSKSPSYVNASFYTCLVFPHNSQIYEILDPIWKQYCDLKKPNITFLEHYEIKSYCEGDSFGLHSDILVSRDNEVERKINLILQLSDDTEYEGGDLYIGSIKCSRELGTGIFFPAKFLHSVSEVKRGNRFSLIGHAWGPISN